jgi:hypothetical protein
MANTSPVSPAPLSRHQRWPEPSGASTKRVYAMRIRRGIGPAGRAERKRLKRKAARDRFKAAHPNRRQELVAARAERERLANLPSAKFWCGAQLADAEALKYVKEHVLTAQREAAKRYLKQVTEECRLAGLNVNRFTLARGGVQAAIVQRRLTWQAEACGQPWSEAVKIASKQDARHIPPSSLEALFLEQAANLGNGAKIAAELDKPWL